MGHRKGASPQERIAATLSATAVASQPRPKSHTGAKGFLGIGRCAPAISPDVFRMLINTTSHSCQAGMSRPCWDPTATGPNLQLHAGGHRSPIIPNPPSAPPAPRFDLMVQKGVHRVTPGTALHGHTSAPRGRSPFNVPSALGGKKELPWGSLLQLAPAHLC